MAPPALAKAVQSRRRGDVDSAVAALQTGANVDAASAVWLRALALRSSRGRRTAPSTRSSSGRRPAAARRTSRP